MKTGLEPARKFCILREGFCQIQKVTENSINSHSDFYSAEITDHRAPRRVINLFEFAVSMEISVTEKINFGLCKLLCENPYLYEHSGLGS